MCTPCVSSRNQLADLLTKKC